MRALHLSGNPGITSKLLEYLKERTHSIHVKLNFIDFT
jgi:hypothetical protein